MYEQELHGARVAQTNSEGDRKRVEAERQQIEERRKEAEDRVAKAVQERTRADDEARGAISQRDDAVLFRQDAEAVALYARNQLEVAENNLREGVRPVVWPTLEELSAAKERLGYEEGLFHFAIAGIAGSGKSSLANAVRGLRNSDDGAAPTGVVETTSAVGRFPDPDPKHPFVWYDVPGAGTLAVPDWQYFTDQGLYIFDCIIVLFDTRLTATDIAILRNAARFDIPTYIVRSKALQHILNLAADLPGEDSDEDDEDAEMSPVVLQRAREMYVKETRASIAQNLEAAKLPQQRVYLVDKDTLVKVVKDKPVKDPIDELDLLRDLLAEAHCRQEEAQRTAEAAREAQEEAERSLREGIRPIIVPTQEQHEATKRRLGYRQGFFHFGVAGISGSGKSSLINAFRGLRNKDVGAAPVGVVEMTMQVARYPDPSTDMPYVWYDVPGAGTLSIPDWQYFTDQGLYILNCIIVVMDGRFTATDIAILRNCVRFQIPSFIVRSKSKQHIANIANDMGGDQDDDDDDEGDRRARMEKAREQYIRATRDNVAQNLEQAGLLAQKVYLIDKDILVKAVKGRSSADAIDEEVLLKDMFALAERPEQFSLNV
ncbi:hypothetical protein FOMPIDRAFT_59934 [Fomitopsis schrenkii]|uniref:IRG-type G domain-containing protein n=1 Tax=Fomitopsis schrenkii TaxID=2126942 RepID=S8DMH7_FOMSC|nr:hypothetical protein FOMPIDRAFT_59934 [Fomitopsis schrenkii]